MNEILKQITIATPIELAEYLERFVSSVENETKGQEFAFKFAIKKVIEELESHLSNFQIAYSLGTQKFCPIENFEVYTKELINTTQMTIDYLQDKCDSYSYKRATVNVECKESPKIEQEEPPTKESEDWIDVKETAKRYPILSFSKIKDPKWRIANNFPYQGYDEKKGLYNGVKFHVSDVEDWIKSYK